MHTRSACYNSEISVVNTKTLVLKCGNILSVLSSIKLKSLLPCLIMLCHYLGAKKMQNLGMNSYEWTQKMSR